jgi:hypothetical protein
VCLLRNSAVRLACERLDSRRPADAVRAGRKAGSAPNLAFRTIVTIAPGLPTPYFGIRDFFLLGLALNPMFRNCRQWSGALRRSARGVYAGALWGCSINFRAGRSVAWFKEWSGTVVQRRAAGNALPELAGTRRAPLRTAHGVCLLLFSAVRQSTLRAVPASVPGPFCIRPFFGLRRVAGNVLPELAGTRRAPLRTAHGVCLLLFSGVRLTPAFGKAWIRWRTRKFLRNPCQKVPNSAMSEEHRNNTKTQLALAVAQGMRVTTWARTYGVPRRTAFRWAKDPQFRAVVEACRRRMMDLAIGAS